MMNGSVVYAGTFDPMTLGHLDLVERCAGLFDSVILAVAAHSVKPGGMFSVAERIEMVSEAVRDMPSVEVDRLDGLLVDFCHRRNVRVVVRGLRAYSDFEAEFQMALTNRKLAPDVETLFMMPKEIHSYVSSSIVREIARHGGDTREFVPPTVQAWLGRIRELPIGANDAH